MTLPWMAAKILLRPVAELRPHVGNARVHSAEQLEQIKASMLAFGFTNPLLVDEVGVLIAGHGRLEAASALGIEKVPSAPSLRQRFDEQALAMIPQVDKASTAFIGSVGATVTPIVIQRR
jgi:ParB-like chromosome segregation protein Spo0J